MCLLTLVEAKIEWCIKVIYIKASVLTIDFVIMCFEMS